MSEPKTIRIRYDKLYENEFFDKMVRSGVGKSEFTRECAFTWGCKDGKGSFQKVKMPPAYEIPDFVTANHVIVLMFTYVILMKKDWCEITLHKVRVFFPKGLHLPFRIVLINGIYNAVPYDWEKRLVDFEHAEPCSKLRLLPLYPKCLMVDTDTRERKRVMVDEEYVPKGLASAYI